MSVWEKKVLIKELLPVAPKPAAERTTGAAKAAITAAAATSIVVCIVLGAVTFS